MLASGSLAATEVSERVTQPGERTVRRYLVEMMKEGKLISVLRGRSTTYRAENSTDGLGGNRWARLCWRYLPFSWRAGCVGRPLTDREGVEFVLEFNSGIHNCPIPVSRETAVHHVDERPWKCTI